MLLQNQTHETAFVFYTIGCTSVCFKRRNWTAEVAVRQLWVQIREFSLAGVCRLCVVLCCSLHFLLVWSVFRCLGCCLEACLYWESSSLLIMMPKTYLPHCDRWDSYRHTVCAQNVYSLKAALDNIWPQGGRKSLIPAEHNHHVYPLLTVKTVVLSLVSSVV